MVLVEEAVTRLESQPDATELTKLPRNKLRMSCNSLDKLASFLNINSKNDLDANAWLRATLDGDRRAMDYIVEHFVEDVMTLERIVDAVKSYSTAFNSWGSGR